MIERRDSEGRCLVSGEAPGVKLDPAYVTTAIHCVVRWDSVNQIVIITMYRPKSSEWLNQFKRR